MNLLNRSNCCPRGTRTRKKFVHPAPVKRTNEGYLNMQQPPSKKAYIPCTKFIKSNNISLVKTAFPARVPQQDPQSNSTISGIVCNPALPIIRAPTPLSLAPVPVLPFHNVKGFQMNLNSTSRQNILRLSNRKFLRVRKQPAVPQSNKRYQVPNATRPNPNLEIRQAVPIFQPGLRTYTRRNRVGAMSSVHTRVNSQFEGGRDVPTPHNQQLATVALPPRTTVFTQENGSISVVRASPPNTPFGRAKTMFEYKIINGLEICQNTINKISKFHKEISNYTEAVENFYFQLP